MNAYLAPNWIRFLIPTAMLCLTPTALRANESLAVVAGGFAEAVNTHLAETNQKVIKIGKFTAIHDPHSNTYGTRIAIALEEELKKFQITVAETAKQTIEGTFSVDTEAKAIKVKAAIVQVSGKSEQSFSVHLGLKSPDEPSELTPLTMPTETAAAVTIPEESSDVVLDRVVSQLGEAEVKDEGEVLFADGETFGGSVKLDKQEDYLVFGERLGVRLREIDPTAARTSPNFLKARVKPLSTKAPHLRLRKDAYYIIELKNYKNDIDLATKILFDGIDTTALSEDIASKEKLLWLAPMKKSVAVYGWHRTDEFSDAFQIVPDEQSVAHRFGSLSHTGRIQINVYAAWDQTKKDAVPAEFKVNGTNRAVGQGVRFANQVKRVKTEFGALLGELVIEYVDDTQPSRLVKK